MIDILWNWYKGKAAEVKYHRTSMELQETILSEASQIVVDRPDRDGFVRMFSTNDREKGHQQSNQLEAIRKSREFERWNAEGHGIIGTMVNYIMGKGLSIMPKSEDPMVWYIWREFWTSDRNKMALKQFEIVKRLFRDGEVFIESFDTTEDGKKSGKTTIRFIDPLLVKAPVTPGQMVAEEDKNGIKTDPEDIEKVLGYHVQSRVNETQFRFIPAEKMLHIKINADSDQKRGEPFMQSILGLMKNYEQWLENRILLNKMRSAIVLIKKVEGTPTEVARLANTIPNASNVAAGETKKQAIRGGTMITEGPGVTYRMEAPNINASDVKEDGRNIKLSMASGTNLPEYMLGDASNANFASTLIAESPFVKGIESWQIFLEYWIGKLFKMVIKNAVDAGLVEAPDDKEFVNKLKTIRKLGEAVEPKEPIEGEEPEEKPEQDPKEAALAELMPDGRMEMPTEVFYGCDMTWPEIVHRDLKQHTDALAVARSSGWISDPTAAAALGYDYAEEVRKQNQIEDEAEAKGNRLLGKQPGMYDDAEMNAELNDLMANMTPQEKAKFVADKKKAAAGVGAEGGDDKGGQDGAA